MSGTAGDLDGILHALREVEASLDRRVARAEGANLMVWGLVGASIFAFYQLATWNHAPYHAALGPLLPWVWVGPVLAGYVLTAVVGARLGRAASDPAVRRDLRLGLVPGALATLLATALVLTERYEYVYGGVTAVVGATTLAFCVPAPRTRFRGWALASGAGMLLVGLALLARPVDWAGLVAALAFVVGLVGLGTVRYRLAG